MQIVLCFIIVNIILVLILNCILGVACCGPAGGLEMLHCKGVSLSYLAVTIRAVLVATFTNITAKDVCVWVGFFLVLLLVLHSYFRNFGGHPLSVVIIATQCLFFFCMCVEPRKNSPQVEKTNEAKPKK